MVASPQPTPGQADQRVRGPQARVHVNLERALDAVVEVLAPDGWAGLSFSSVSRSSGLSTRAVHNRFGDRSAMASAAFTSRSCAALLASLTEVLVAAGLLDRDPLDTSTQGVPAPTASSRFAQAVFMRPTRVDPWERVRAAVRDASAQSLERLPGAPSLRTAPDPGQPAPGTRKELAGLALWQSLQQLTTALDSVSLADAAIHLEDLREDGPSAEWLEIALDAFQRPSPALKAAVELLIVSHFDEQLAAAIQECVSPTVAAWCTPASSGPSPETAARRAYLLSIALGLVLVHDRLGAPNLDLSDEVLALAAAIQVDRKPVPLPADRAAYIEADIPFGTGDEALDRLLQATVDLVALRGFDGATTSAIARAAGCSEALIFARYPTKMALFLDASRRQQAVAYRNYDEYQTSIRTTHGMGIADALALREVQRPEASLQRSTYLEQVRLSWHDEELRASLALEFDAFVADATAADPDWAPANSPSSLHMSIALGQGISLLPTLAPNVWALPYDVITIPLAEASDPG